MTRSHECIGFGKGKLFKGVVAKSFVPIESFHYAKSIGAIMGVWKTQNAGTIRISPNGFIFAISVTCKHYRATDGEDFATELTQLTVAFNIILTIKQLRSVHGKSKYLGEH